MSNKMLNAVWPLQMPAPPKAVLVSLADRCNARGECWPSIADLTRRTCLAERTVQAALRWLEESQVVSRFRTKRRTWTYKVRPESFSARDAVHGLHPKRIRRAPAAPTGVQEMHVRGAPPAPEPSVNHQEELSLLAGASLGEKVFKLGKQLLTESGTSARAAGSLLGRLRKDHGDEVVLAAIESARLAHVSEPAAWLVKACGAVRPAQRRSLAVGAQDYDADWPGSKEAA